MIMVFVCWFLASMPSLTMAATVRVIKSNEFFSISGHAPCEVDQLDSTCVKENAGVLPLGRCSVEIRSLPSHQENEYVVLNASLVTGSKQSLGLYRNGALGELHGNPASGVVNFEWPLQKLDVIRWNAGGSRFRSLTARPGWRLCLRAKLISLRPPNPMPQTRPTLPPVSVAPLPFLSFVRTVPRHIVDCVVDNDTFCVVARKRSSYGRWTGRCLVRILRLPTHQINEIVVASKKSTYVQTLRRQGAVLHSSLSKSEWPVLVGDELEWRTNREGEGEVCLRVRTMPIVSKNHIFSIENATAACSVDPHDGNCLRLTAESRQCQATINSLPFDEPVVATSSERGGRGVLGLYREEKWVHDFPGDINVDSQLPVKVGDKLNWTAHRSPAGTYNGTNSAWKVCLQPQNPAHNFSNVTSMPSLTIGVPVRPIESSEFFNISSYEPCRVDYSDTTCVKEYPDSILYPYNECSIRIRSLPPHRANEYVVLNATLVTESWQSISLYRNGALKEVDGNPASGVMSFEWPIEKSDLIRWDAGNPPVDLDDFDENPRKGWRLCLHTKLIPKGFRRFPNPIPQAPPLSVVRSSEADCLADNDPFCVGARRHNRHAGPDGFCGLRIRRLPTHQINEIVVALNEPLYVHTLRRQGAVLQSSVSPSEWPVLVGDELEWSTSKQGEWRVCLRVRNMPIVSKNHIFSIENATAACSVDPHDGNCLRLTAESRQCQATIHSLPFDEPVVATSSERVGSGVLGLYRDENLVRDFPGDLSADSQLPVKAGDKLNWTAHRSPNQLAIEYNGSNFAWKVCLQPQNPALNFFNIEQGPCMVSADEPMCIYSKRNSSEVDHERCRARIARLPTYSANETIVLRRTFHSETSFQHFQAFYSSHSFEDMLSNENLTFDWRVAVGDLVTWRFPDYDASVEEKRCLTKKRFM